MTYIALAIVTLGSHAALVAAFILHLKAQTGTIATMTGALNEERAQWTAERRELLNRIKPETAQYQAPVHAATDTPAVALDDDQQVWAALQNMSAEEFAQRMADTERQLAANQGAE